MSMKRQEQLFSAGFLYRAKKQLQKSIPRSSPSVGLVPLDKAFWILRSVPAGSAQSSPGQVLRISKFAKFCFESKPFNWVVQQWSQFYGNTVPSYPICALQCPCSIRCYKLQVINDMKQSRLLTTWIKLKVVFVSFVFLNTCLWPTRQWKQEWCAATIQFWPSCFPRSKGPLEGEKTAEKHLLSIKMRNSEFPATTLKHI